MLLESAEVYWKMELLDEFTWYSGQSQEEEFYYPYSNSFRYVLVYHLEASAFQINISF